MLNLQYADEVPQALRDLVEHHGRRLGVPLGDLETLGQSLDLAEGFVLAAEQGFGLEYATTPSTRRTRVLLECPALIPGTDPRVRA